MRVRVCVRVRLCMVLGQGGLRGGGRKERKKKKLAVQKNAATVHKMGHYPSTVYHYVVDKSMALTVMAL